MVVMVGQRHQSTAYYHKQTLLKETINSAVTKKCRSKGIFQLKIKNNKSIHGCFRETVKNNEGCNNKISCFHMYY